MCIPERFLQNEIDPDEFLNFLTQQLNSDVSPSCDQLTSDLIPSCGQLTVKSYTCDTDHRYDHPPAVLKLLLLMRLKVLKHFYCLLKADHPL